MPSVDHASPKLASLISKDIMRRAFCTALALGSVLMLTNQSGAIFGNDKVQVLPLFLVYLTPFVVVIVSQVLGTLRAMSDARSTNAFAYRGKAFFSTAISHGIPFRALLVASVIGTATTWIVALAALMAHGTVSNLPTAQILQAFALPMLFGLVSQTISYRRTVTAIGQQL